MTSIHVRPANLHDPQDAAAIVELLDMYSRHEFGSGQPLSPFVRQQLIPGLQQQPGCLVLLAYDDERPVGLAICFWGFSSFNARPLLNIHDLAVAPEARGKGVGWKLLEAVEAAARGRNACRVTLEVREDNETAKRLYERFGIVPGKPQNWFWYTTLE